MADRIGNSSDTPVSVVLYVHNGEPFLTAAIDSIRAQTHQNFELCVVDDGSTDGTPRILSRVAELDERVRILRQDAKGRTRLHETFNTCLSMANHDLVAIANADDIWRPDKLERQLVEFADDPRLDVCYHEATFIDANDRVLYGGFRKHPTPYPTSPPRPWQFVAGNPVPNPTVMFRRAIVRRVGLQEVGDMHDHQFWFKATVAGCRFKGVSDRLIRYRIHEGSHSTSNGRRAVIVDSHLTCVLSMIERYSIEELLPELSLVDPRDEDSTAWAYSFIAGALWTCGAHEAAESFWRQAFRHSDDPAILFGLGLAESRRGPSRDATRLLRAAANGGVAHAWAIVNGQTHQDELLPPTWQGRKPPIAEIVAETDRTGLDLDRDSHPSSFDVVLVLPREGDEPAGLAARLADRIVAVASDTAVVRMISLVSHVDDVAALARAHEDLCTRNPEIADRLHLEVDIVSHDQQQSVVEAHRMDGALIAA